MFPLNFGNLHPSKGELNNDTPRSSHQLFLVILIQTLLVLSACGLPSSVDSEGDIPSNTATAASTPTSTHEPTKTPTVTPSPTQTPIPQPPLLQVEGNTFIDENGDIVQLRGVAITEILMLASGDYVHLGEWEEELFEVLDEWGADIVRIPINPPNFSSYGATRSLTVLDQAIEWAGKYGMYVIIDFHGLGFPPDGYSKYEWSATTEAGMINFWKTVSRRYAGNNTVAFYQYYNEPMRDNSRALNLNDWLVWKEFSEKMIDTIRENDPDTMIIVSGMKGGNNLWYVLQAPIERENIVYEAHPFPGVSRWLPWEKAFGAVSEVYPVIVEFGFDNDQTDDEFLQESSFVGAGRYRDAIMEYIEERGLSWTTWVFSHDWTPRMLIDRDYTPSEFGQFVKEQLLLHKVDE
jgi:endoglucanase